jgi:hypothetical protein
MTLPNTFTGTNPRPASPLEALMVTWAKDTWRAELVGHVGLPARFPPALSPATEARN